MGTFTGTTGDDTFRGGTSNDLILGRQGADSLSGGGGNDTIYGGQGDDTLAYGAGALNEGPINPAAQGNLNSGSNLVYGDQGSDTIFSAGSTGRNTIYGGVDSNDGADLIDARNDTGADLILGNGGADTILLGQVPGGGLFTFANSVVGGYGNDTIVAAGGANLILGNQGNDSISLNGGSNTVYGGQDNDFINDSLGGGNDVLYGNQGSDTIYVGGGNNTIYGGDDSTDGADLIVDFGGTRGNDVILGNGGNDTLDVSRTTGTTNTLVGGFGNDSILSGAGVNDVILGNQGNDTIALGANTGVDTVYGGSGDDSVTSLAVGSTSTGKAVVYGSEGNDVVNLVDVGSSVTVYGGVDSVGAGDGINSLVGGTANDFIYGGASSDTIIGGFGADTEHGGAGADVFRSFGGTTTAGDSDSYTFTAGTSGGVGTVTGTDFITDLNTTEGDKLSIRDGAVGGDGAAAAINGVNAGVVSEDNNPDATSLQAAANAAVTGSEGTNPNNNAAVFSYQSNTYVVADIDGNAGFAGDGGDYLVKVTGYTGTIDKTTFV